MEKMERKSVTVLIDEAVSNLEEVKPSDRATAERIRQALLALEQAKTELLACVTLLAGGVCPEKTPIRS
jgi:hypothetical protein